MNNTISALRQREGAPGDRHGHRPPAHRRQLLSRRARSVATHFTPAPSSAAARARTGTSSTRPTAKKLLTEAGFDERLRDRALLPRRGARLPARARRGGAGHPGPAQAEPGHRRRDRRHGVWRFPRRGDQGRRCTLYLLGWGADYPDQTNFLDYHFGAGASPQFGTGFPDIDDHPEGGRRWPTRPQRKQLYDEANDLVKQHVPMMPVAHGGSATAFKADVEGAHASPLTHESFA